jgi:hypothetical protein
MQPTLEDQERHLLVKVIDRILFKLDELVRPYVHKVLVVIEPLLIDEDYYARVEVGEACEPGGGGVGWGARLWQEQMSLHLCFGCLEGEELSSIIGYTAN